MAPATVTQYHKLQANAIDVYILQLTGKPVLQSHPCHIEIAAKLSDIMKGR
jgi:hypothetical protein